MDPNRQQPPQPPQPSSSSAPMGDSDHPPPAAAAPHSDPWPGRAPPQSQDASTSHQRSSSVSSRFSFTRMPASPDAVEDSETEYFPVLRGTPTVRSRNSANYSSSRPVSVAGSDLGRPVQDRARHPSIRIRRSSSTSLQPPTPGAAPPPSEPEGTSAEPAGQDAHSRARPRSISQPTPAHLYPDANLARHSRRVPPIALPRLTEEGSRPTLAELGVAQQSPISPTRSLPEEPFDSEGRRPSSVGSEPPARRLAHKRKLSRLFWPGSSNRQSAPPHSATGFAHQHPTRSDEFDEELVDLLDVIDPEVQTLSTLTNVQNTLFVPDLGPLINRRPAYVLSQHPAEPLLPLPRPELDDEGRLQESTQRRASTRVQAQPSETGQEVVTLRRSDTITSKISESHYAALPHGIRLEGWTEEEKRELDDHVRHMLHSRRSKFKRTMKGFGQYVRRPLGFFVTLYATLITLFGLAWVLFLIGWIYVGDRQLYAIHVIDSVLVALFGVMGYGLAPFRAIDTYHTIFVVYYTRKIERARKKKEKSRSRRWSGASEQEAGQSMELTHNRGVSTEELASHIQPVSDSQNPDASFERIATSTGDVGNEPRNFDQNIDIEGVKLDVEYDEDSPLTYAQWKSLRHHQKKLARSHSFYKPDETFTHFPFPLGYLIAIVILVDCHSCLQICLGATTWGISYHRHRIHTVVTTVILCVSITCNLTAGLVISIGDRKTRKKDVWNLLNRQELTGDAMKRVEARRAKEQSRSHESGITEENQQEDTLVKEV